MDEKAARIGSGEATGPAEEARCFDVIWNGILSPGRRPMPGEWITRMRMLETEGRCLTMAILRLQSSADAGHRLRRMEFLAVV